jgi:plastocyanin
MNYRTTKRVLLSVVVILSAIASAQVTLTARVALVSGNDGRAPKPRDVVMWLTPVGGSLAPVSLNHTGTRPRLVQKDKSFQPHILVVPVGTVVEFPNRDPFFHNVFSLFEGKRFDLGLYEAGSSKDVHFDKPGISYIFCNIHAQMSAIVIALDSPYYGISDQHGRISIPRVPPGRYTLHAWYESALPETLNALTREVTVSPADSTLGLFKIMAATVPQEHKNMYGKDYEPPAPASPGYERP